MKKWRDNNPEKVIENNYYRNNNINYHYRNYQRTAELKNLDFELSFEEFCEIVQEKCYYCGEFSENKSFIGIDRKDQKQGYLIDNCVSSCEMCNMMKKSLNDRIFLQRVEHILTYNKLVNGKFYNYAFSEHYNITYTIYINSAKKRNIIFQLSKHEFDTITNNPCYICGKTPNKNHKNGIDRFNNMKGYLIDNCRPCCGECNYMKNNYDYNEMMRKFQCIYKNKIQIKKESNEEKMVPENIVIEIIEEKTTENIVIENNSGSNVYSETEPKRETLTKTEESEDIIIEQKKTKNILFNTIPIMNDKTPRENKIMVQNNKQTIDEIRKKATERKRLQRERLKEKYGDEEYKKMHARQIAENRKKMKLKEATNNA